MGIDVAAFGDRVERPQDTAADRGELFSVTDSFAVSSGSFTSSSVHTNNSGVNQFVQLVNLSQVPSSTRPLQSDVSLQVRVTDPSRNPVFRVFDTGGTLTETLPSLTVSPDDSVRLFVNNGSGSQIRVDTTVTLRQG